MNNDLGFSDKKNHLHSTSCTCRLPTTTQRDDYYNYDKRNTSNRLTYTLIYVRESVVILILR